MALHIKELLPKFLEQDDWRIDLARRWDSVVGSLQTKMRLKYMFGYDKLSNFDHSINVG